MARSILRWWEIIIQRVTITKGEKDFYAISSQDLENSHDYDFSFLRAWISKGVRIGTCTGLVFTRANFENASCRDFGIGSASRSWDVNRIFSHAMWCGSTSYPFLVLDSKPLRSEFSIQSRKIVLYLYYSCLNESQSNVFLSQNFAIVAPIWLLASIWTTPNFCPPRFRTLKIGIVTARW